MSRTARAFTRWSLAILLLGCDLADRGQVEQESESAPTKAAPEAPPTTAESTPKPSPSASKPTLKSTQEIIELAKAAGEDRAKLEAALTLLDARLAAKESVEDRYLRAQILDRLQRREDALVALQATLRLDPDHVGAHHLAGLLAADLGREDEAVEHWAAAARGKPPHPGAAYNAGQYFYNAKRYDEALEMWRITLQTSPDDFDAAKKIVQALNALGRHDDAERAKTDVKRIFAASADPRVKKQNEFVIDQLVVGGHAVMVRETITPPDPRLHYHWVAAVLADDGKTPMFTVQLESSAYGRETGVPFINGMKRGDTHSTWAGHYEALPPYGTWRAAAIEKIAQEI